MTLTGLRLRDGLVGVAEKGANSGHTQTSYLSLGHSNLKAAILAADSLPGGRPWRARCSRMKES